MENKQPYRIPKNEQANSGNLNIEAESLIGNLKVPFITGKNIAWQQIEQKINLHQPTRTITMQGYWRAIAACLILLITTGAMIVAVRNAEKSFMAPRAGFAEIELPDHSKVTLNADSELKFNRIYWFFNRTVHLDGEALFVVTKGKTFSVETNLATIEVLGTVFNVYSRISLLKVHCIEGKVCVTEKKQERTTIITKGNLVSSDIDGKLERKTGQIPMTSGWPNGDFYYNNTPLNQVFEEIERQFDIHIETEPQPERFYTGYFSNHNLDTALKLVCIPMRLKWTAKGKTIKIEPDSDNDIQIEITNDRKQN